MTEPTTDPTTDPTLDELKARLNTREQQITAMHRISAALFSKTDTDSLLRETLTVALDTVDADAGSLLLYEPESGKLVFRYVIGDAANTLRGQELDIEDHANSKAATVFRTGQPLITSDTRIDVHDPFIDQTTGYRTDSILTVPLRNMGEPIGVMQAINRRHGVFDQEDRELLEIIGSLASTSIVNASLAEEAQLAAVARAVGDLGHDIKNALTPVETAIDTLVQAFIEPMYEDLDAISETLQKENLTIADAVAKATSALRYEYPHMVISAKDGCDDIREMVSEIADYIKGAQATHFQVGDVQDVLEQRLHRLKVVAGNRRVTLHLNCASDVPSFPFDSRLVGRAVFNLVNNALGAISDAVKKKIIELPDGGFNVWVSASSEPSGMFPEGSYCMIDVRDDGPGVPPEIKETLFTPNAISTTPGGTGIGTRFVRSVADAHGGHVGLDSEPGKGARFWMKLPLEQPDSRVLSG
jgi:signal transduction histidine kinase